VDSGPVQTVDRSSSSSRCGTRDMMDSVVERLVVVQNKHGTVGHETAQGYRQCYSADMVGL
jgi:hypothetical protein